MIPTQFFFSVYINGRFETINDNQKKKYILHNLVKKYEPQEHIDMDSIQFKGQEKGGICGNYCGRKYDGKSKIWSKYEIRR